MKPTASILEMPTGSRAYSEAAVVIIGAGVSGICMAIELLRRGSRDFIIIEKSTGVGGTWRDNRYPGCCCDVWSHLYSYSFEQNPDWSADYAGQEEILEYLEKVARKYDLYRHMRYNTSVDKAEWDDINSIWSTTVSVAGGKESEFCRAYTIKSAFLVSAVGQLNVPRLPEIEGLSDFVGKVMHSARWDRSYKLTGKKVAVIGTGSTAAQIVPEVAKVASSLTVHQRDPNWIVPRFNQPIPVWRRRLYKYLPMLRWLKRSGMMDLREKSFKVVVSPTPQIGEWYEGVSTAHMKNQLPDRVDLWQMFTPKYKLGCKRVVVSDDYYPTFLRDTVKLETGHIDRISTKGIVVDGREEAYDLIVLATGFRSVNFMYPIQIVGRNKRTLSDIWADGPEALNGVCVQNMPNFAMLYGPNTNLSHNSIILMIEAQSRYISALISSVFDAREAGSQLVLQPKTEKLVQYNQRIQSELARTNYADPNCSSWYKIGSNGRITNNWSSTAVDYQKLLSTVVWDEYEVSGPDATQLTRGANTVTPIGRVLEESSDGKRRISVVALATLVAGFAFKFGMCLF